MKEETDFIKKLYEKVSAIEDEETRKMVLKLIDERNYLKNTIRIDPLTGLYNRRILEKIRDYSLVSMIDIDNFKSINDVFGHSAGDEVIKLVASTIKDNTRINDYVIRYGGDEFLAIFTDVELEIVKQRMQKIREEVAEKTKLIGLDISLSIGIASYEPNSSLDDVIEKADELMYLSKKSGKDTISTYEDVTGIKK